MSHKLYRITDEGTWAHPAYAVRERQEVGYTGVVWKLVSYQPSLQEAISHVHLLGGKLVPESLNTEDEEGKP